jgi:hypothetical protein
VPPPKNRFLEETTVFAGHEVGMDADDNRALIVGDPQGILSQQLKSNSYTKI